MITTTYTCDRCKRVLEDAEQLSEISVIFKNSGYISYTDGQRRVIESRLKPVQWCDACIGETGFASFRKVEASIPAPTIEDFIRTMIYATVDEAIRSLTP
jgi:hypothetical protein